MQPTSSTIDLDSFNRLVGDIYEAALNHAHWSVALARISHCLNARSAILRAQDLHTKEVGTYVLHNLAPEYQEQYKAHYVHVDPLVPAVAKLPVGSITQTITYMPESFFKSEFYNDFARPQGMGHTMGCILSRNNSQLAVMGLHRVDRRGNYDPHELALLELLIPHLQRALQVNRRLWQLTGEVNATHDALHRLTIGVILVDASGKPLFLNKQAEAIVAAGNGLTLSKNILRAPTWSETQTLHKLIFDAAQAPQRSGGGMSVSGPGLAQPLSILVTPVGKEQDKAFQLDNARVAAALFFGSAGQQLEFFLEGLIRLYGLTRAEARLAAALANGHSLEKIAKQFGVSKHTVRSQLKSCFRKTGTNRQTELVKLMLCTPAALIESGFPYDPGS